MSYPIENLNIDRYCIEFDMRDAHYCFHRMCFRHDATKGWIATPMLDGLPSDFRQAILNAMNGDKVSA